MPGRNISLSNYRFGFNTQEKVDEISGKGNHNTALFWEYDTRLGTRWNRDSKPDLSQSLYACFASNPIWTNDPMGDTTYLYNEKATYIGVIYDKLTSNEIIFTSEMVANTALHLTNNGIRNADKAASALRSPLLNYARFTEKTAEDLSKNWKDRGESTGVLYVNPKTHELQVWKCSDCPSVQFPNGSAETNIQPIGKHLNEVRKLGTIFGVWHSHPVDYFSGIDPTDGPLGDAPDVTNFGSGISEMNSGGLGIITGKTQMAVYPLADLSKQGIERFRAKKSEHANGTGLFIGKYNHFSTKNLSPINK